MHKNVKLAYFPPLSRQILMNCDFAVKNLQHRYIRHSSNNNDYIGVGSILKVRGLRDCDSVRAKREHKILSHAH